MNDGEVIDLFFSHSNKKMCKFMFYSKLIVLYCCFLGEMEEKVFCLKVGDVDKAAHFKDAVNSAREQMRILLSGNHSFQLVR